MSTVDAMQAQLKALEAQLAAAKEQEAMAGGADPEGEYILEYDEEGDEVYVIEEYEDDGEYDDEIIEIVEEYADDDEYEEIIEEEEIVEEDGLPPIDPVVDDTPVQRSSLVDHNRSVSFSDANLDGVGQAAVAPPVRARKAHPMAAAFEGGGTAKAAEASVPVVAAATAKAAAPKLRATPRPAPPPPTAKKSSGIELGSVKLRKTGIEVKEEEPDTSPYKYQGPPPKAQVTKGPPPKAQEAREKPEDIPKPHAFLAGVAQSQDMAVDAEQRALELADESKGPQVSKKWIPMKERDSERLGKNSLEIHETPKKKTTTLMAIPFKPRPYPTIPASPAGKEIPAEKLLGPYLYKNPQLERVNVTGAIKDQDILCLYFGAAWRQGCKAFHQQLIDFYKLTSKECNLEIVYVSADRTLFEFKDIYAKFPFLAMPTGTADLKNAMTQKFTINDMPALIVLDAQTCDLITLDGVEDVSSVPKRDKEFSKKMVAKWKATKPTAAGRAAPKAAAPAAAPSTATEQAPAPAGQTPQAGKHVGRKERKGIFSWKKR